MKSFTTALLALVSASAANAWTLYCGDSCTNGTAVISGDDDYQGATCTDISDLYDHCYFESEQAWYYAVVYGKSDCVVGSSTPSAVIQADECTSAGPFLSYQVVVDL